jgi:DNA repair protein RadD
MTLRYYQRDALDDLDRGWSRGLRCQLLRMGTGTGKSKTSAHALADNTGGGLMMAHRREIVAQLALALAREGVRHRVIGPPDLARLCMQTQIADLGTHYVAPGAKVGVASTDSLAALKGEDAFLRQVTLAVPDEFHHYLRENAYGKALHRLNPTCRIIGPTATPARTDGKGLGVHAHGFAQEIVHGPTEAKMMQEGYLCQYRIYIPPTDFDRSALGLGASHEFKKEDVKRESGRSHIFGDAVDHYTKHTPGRTALAFVDSLESAGTLCGKFRAAGVRAEVLSGKTEAGLRTRTLKSFAQGGVDVVISVQLIDEGFDCPSVAVVLDLAATTSVIRYRQRFGRGWRPDESKEYFMYFDFVGNVAAHGLPEAYRKWTLDARSVRGKSEPSDHIPTRTCANPLCNCAYERALVACPYCGEVPEPAARTSPAQVDGDLVLLDEDTRMRMLGEIAKLDQPPRIPYGATHAVVGHLRNVHHAKQQAQASLRDATALWGGWQAAQGRDTREGFKRFYFRYGMSMWDAWALGATEAASLEEVIRRDLRENGIIDATVK